MIGIIKTIVKNIKDSFTMIFPTFYLNMSALHKDRGEIFYKSYQKQQNDLIERIQGTDLHELLLSKIGEDMKIEELIEWYFLIAKNVKTPKTLKAQLLFSEPIDISEVKPGDILRNTKKNRYSPDNGRSSYFHQNPVIYVGTDKFKNQLGITVSESLRKVILIDVDFEDFSARRYKDNN